MVATVGASVYDSLRCQPSLAGHRFVSGSPTSVTGDRLVSSPEAVALSPYYQDDLVTIYHGDARDILPDIRADVMLTDPPYGIGKDGQTPTTGGHGGRKGYAFRGWDGSRPDRTTFDLMLAAADQHIIWGGNYFADLLPPTSRWLVWDKGQRINQSDGELAWTSMDAALRIFTLNRAALIADGPVHPTQKPLSLMRWCLGFVPDARSVIDPFMGSGSTLVAAKDMGKRVIGIDADEHWCEVAARRCSQEVLGLVG